MMKGFGSSSSPLPGCQLEIALAIQCKVVVVRKGGVEALCLLWSSSVDFGL
jgi:hypothetical protein